MRWLSLAVAALAILLFLRPEAQSQGAAAQLPTTRQDLMFSYAPLVKKTAPAVVNIYSRRKERTLSPIVNDPMYQLFSGGQVPAVIKERVVQSLGSGVIIDPKGVIVTNGHVIKGAEEIRVVLADKREMDAKVIVADSKTDIALLKLDAGGEPLPYLELKDSDEAQVGDLVVAIGNPFGLEQTVTTGIVSALARTTVGITDYQFFIQTDAAINPGNSGGALVTMDGKLLGINTAIFSKSGGSQGIGFATPANIIRAIQSSLQADGKILRPWIGAGFQAIDGKIAESLGMPRPMGVLVARVMDKGPADRAGLKLQDIILKIDNYEVNDPQTLRYRIATLAPGRQVTLTVKRSSDTLNIPLRLESPTYNPAPDYLNLKGEHPLSGTRIANLSPGLANELDLDMESRGVVVTAVEPNSPAARIGFKPGDMIDQANGRKAESTQALVRLLKDATREWVIVVARGGQKLELRWVR
ncbi:Do family serine endopeptidase [bacterium]|nr:Do family serine endopeptidase [bacterium]